MKILHTIFQIMFGITFTILAILGMLFVVGVGGSVVYEYVQKGDLISAGLLVLTFLCAISVFGIIFTGTVDV